MSINRFAAISSILIVLLAVLAGLYHSGSPRDNRRLAIDELRVNDLRQIHNAISSYWNRHSRLPENLKVLVDGIHMQSLLTDPEPLKAYKFKTIGKSSYQLCANFSIASNKSSTNDFWAHEAGEQCFTFVLKSDK